MTADLTIVYRAPGDLRAYENNARTHSPEQIEQLRASLREFGFTNPILLKDDGVTIGAGRCAAAIAEGMAQVPTITLQGLTETQWRAYVIADNQLATTSGWDLDILRAEIASLGDDFDLDTLGFDSDALEGFLSPADDPAQDDTPKASMADKFGIPPFTVMNAREGWWQDRKRAWLARGIQSELGRGVTSNMIGGNPDGKGLVDYQRQPDGGKRPQLGAATSFDSQDTLNAIMDQRRPKKGLGATPSALGRAGPGGDAEAALTTGTSIFDPVLCELSYRWFCPPGGTVLDPFAGGSVRGLVAAWLGLAYIGGDLSARQIEANREQAERLIENDTAPVWVQGDSRTLEANLTAAGIEDEADMIMTCPPYADLEVYSDDPADLSNMPYPDFIAGYREALAQACGRLKNNRFAVVVVGEVRDPKGNYRNFVGDTVEAMRAAGMHFYNEAILITMVGSLPVRAGKQFAAGRKLGKTHQNVLVFVKGDGKAATQACGPVEFAANLEAGPEPDLEPV